MHRAAPPAAVGEDERRVLLRRQLDGPEGALLLQRPHMVHPGGRSSDRTGRRRGVHRRAGGGLRCTDGLEGSRGAVERGGGEVHRLADAPRRVDSRPARLVREAQELESANPYVDKGRPFPWRYWRPSPRSRLGRDHPGREHDEVDRELDRTAQRRPLSSSTTSPPPSSAETRVTLPA